MSLKKVVLNLTLPFVLLNAFATAEYSAAALILFGIILVVTLINNQVSKKRVHY